MKKEGAVIDLYSVLSWLHCLLKIFPLFPLSTMCKEGQSNYCVMLLLCHLPTDCHIYWLVFSRWNHWNWGSGCLWNWTVTPQNCLFFTSSVSCTAMVNPIIGAINDSLISSLIILWWSGSRKILIEHCAFRAEKWVVIVSFLVPPLKLLISVNKHCRRESWKEVLDKRKEHWRKCCK